MFFLNMVDYPVFFPSLSTLTWDTFLTLGGPWGSYLNHVQAVPKKTPVSVLQAIEGTRSAL